MPLHPYPVPDSVRLHTVANNGFPFLSALSRPILTTVAVPVKCRHSLTPSIPLSAGEKSTHSSAPRRGPLGVDHRPFPPPALSCALGIALPLGSLSQRSPPPPALHLSHFGEVENPPHLSRLNSCAGSPPRFPHLVSSLLQPSQQSGCDTTQPKICFPQTPHFWQPGTMSISA